MDLKKLKSYFSQIPSLILLYLVWFYRIFLSGYFGGSCRFEPSCSVYAEQCLKRHRPFFALKLIVSRLLKCRPAGPFGSDPVPERLVD